ncbi:MAG: hypothetical protein HZA54_12405 [Planctomycetes bacterium]|nr:hypothetical protein [Planctomycetota bacterium]
MSAQSFAGRRGPRGYALVAVIVLMTVGLSLWAIAHRGTATALRLERLHRLRQDRDGGSGKAAVEGLHRLEQEIPASGDQFTFSTWVGGRARSYTVRFDLVSQNGPQRIWTVTVTPVPE